ncbi:MAG: DNA translocase FtsK [Lachnospiraceae bacterium]|nr:DNA translocase FtsK [Lachnospiraceae bacterium]
MKKRSEDTMAAGSGSRTGTKKSTGTANSGRTGTGKSTRSTGSGRTSRSAGTAKSTAGRRKASSGRTGKKRQSAAARRRQQELYREAGFIVACVFLAFLFLCNFGIAGPVGNFFKGIMFGLFGLTAYAAPLLLAAGLIYWWACRGQGTAYRKIVPGFLLLIDVSAFCELFGSRLGDMSKYSAASFYQNSVEYWNGGGLLGGSLAYCLYHYLSTVGAVLVLLAIAVICAVLLTEKSFVGLLQSVGLAAGSTARESADSARQRAEIRAQERRSRREQEALEREDQEEEPAQERRGGFFPWVHLLNEGKSGRAEKNGARHSAPLQSEAAGAYEDLDQISEAGEKTGAEVQKETAAPFRKSARSPEPIPVRPVREEEAPEEEEYDSSDSDGIRELTRRNTYYTQETWQEALEAEEQPNVASRGEFGSEQYRTGQPEVDRVREAAGQPQIRSKAQNEDRSPEIQDGAQDKDMPPSTWYEPMEEAEGSGVKAGAGPGSTAGQAAFAAGAASEFPENETDSPRGKYVQREIPREILYGEKSAEKEEKPLPAPKYQFPPLQFLNPGKPGTGDSPRELAETARRLQSCLETFGVKVTITDISRGPAVTRYEIQPEQGVKVSKIVNLSDDIKLNLAATDIRIEAPIPGKAAIGIEVPNRENSPVPLRELLESKEFQGFHSKLAFAVGKDISGKVVVTDIAKMPHVLIAGATGSGKSVCINTIILSLIYKATPEEVQMIMIDPKVVELNIYNGIPHLMIPVVTDPKKAAAALHWGVAEMMDRYEKFAQMGVRDLKGYNAKIESAKTAEDGTQLKKLPQIVIIVDELADLMMVSPGEVEESICRLAQLARAAGIHLIIATQRPSVDVITGLIKANMPSRIAFSVTSGVDSRTILDMVGAEKLLGKGDMLFYPQGYAKPVRIQGAFVTEEEISKVVDFLKNQKLGNVYQADIEEKMKNLGSGTGADGQTAGQAVEDKKDALFADAGRFIIEKDKASIGMLQRAFRIGFNRAARIMDQLCDYGVVGEEEGTKPRKVLMSPEQFEQLLEEI